MIKINLLPVYILERRRLRALIKFFALVLVAEVVLLALYCWAPFPLVVTTSLSSQVKKRTSERDAALAEENAVRALESQRDAEIAKSADPRAWVTWFDDSQGYNKSYPKVFRYINRYIPNNVVITDFSVAPGQRQYVFQGATDSPASVYRFYYNLRRSPYVVEGSVQFGLQKPIPGWPNPELVEQVAGSGAATALASLGSAGTMPGMPVGGPGGATGGMGDLMSLPQHRIQFGISFMVTDPVSVTMPTPPANAISPALAGAAGLGSMSLPPGVSLPPGLTMPGGAGMPGLPAAAGMPGMPGMPMPGR